MTSYAIDYFSKIKTTLIGNYVDLFEVDAINYATLIDYSKETPVTYRNKKTIYLCCNTSDLKQVLFQLSHELLHAVIPKNVPANLRWFEETLAILASYELPISFNIIDRSSYYKYINDYFITKKSFCVNNVRLPNPDEYDTLEKGSGTDNYNDYGSYWNIAKAMHPYVRKSSGFWSAIPLLCDVKPNQSFLDSMTEWMDSAPLDKRDAIAVVISPFFDSGPMSVM